MPLKSFDNIYFVLIEVNRSCDNARRRSFLKSLVSTYELIL